jgi:DNA-binding winged helix-turn-helix (wHTH) protein
MHVRFDDFTLDTETRQLRQGDAERHLSPKAFELLRVLVENRPRVLPKAELHEALWPATYVTEATLSSVVAEVREALGETGRDGRYVRTVHRFGYGFSGTVTDLTPRAAPADDRIRCWVLWKDGQVGLKAGEHIVGRDADVAVWLDSPTVSRHHARIAIAGDDATIEDLGSTNGTFVRGEPVSAPSPLADGDEIRLGSVVVRLRMVGSAAALETQKVT